STLADPCSCRSPGSCLPELSISGRRVEGRPGPAGSLARGGHGVEAGRRHLGRVEQPIEVIFGQICLLACHLTNGAASLCRFLGDISGGGVADGRNKAGRWHESSFVDYVV